MVRTRFAPSPTGYLHIGGVRTALFNWLFARKHGGQFLLRIDDTDQQRNVEAALAPILHGFRWLGLDWDEGPEVGGPHAPYFQSQRSHRYLDAVTKLLAAGLAYRDFATAEEVAAERTSAEQEKRPFVYSRKWMAETEAQAKSFEGQGRAGVVRLKMPREGSLTIPDLVRGDVQFDWAREQDHVIQRADGTCLYHLASVVDDFDFEISHVIRAEEHLSNTPRQIFIAQSLGYPLPEYAHLPYVAEPGSKNKLSKRKLDKYLKNKDFAAVHNHGGAVAQGIKNILRQSDMQAATFALNLVENAHTVFKGQGLQQSDREIAGLLLSVPEAREMGIDKFLQSSKYKNSPADIRDAVVDASRIVIEQVVSHLEKPDSITQFRHGMKIWRQMHNEAPPETFNPVIVDFYEQVGYLPDAILNYLVLLGWSLDDKTELFSRDEMIANFSLERVTKAPASFDPKKLWSFQDRYMQQVPPKKKLPHVIPYLQKAGLVDEPVQCEVGPTLLKIVEAAGDRIKTYGDILNFTDFFTADDKLDYDPVAFDKRIRNAPGAVDLLTQYRTQLAAVDSFDPPTLEKFTHDFIAASGKPNSELVHPLRVSLTGKSVGLGLFDTLAILGRERSLRRIELAIARAK